MPYLKSNQKTDALEYGIRFGCGAIFGVGASFLIFRRMMRDDWAVGMIAGAIVCGVLAAWKGDDFYKQFFE